MPSWVAGCCLLVVVVGLLQGVAVCYGFVVGQKIMSSEQITINQAEMCKFEKKLEKKVECRLEIVVESSTMDGSGGTFPVDILRYQGKNGGSEEWLDVEHIVEDGDKHNFTIVLKSLSDWVDMVHRNLILMTGLPNVMRVDKGKTSLTGGITMNLTQAMGCKLGYLPIGCQFGKYNEAVSYIAMGKYFLLAVAKLEWTGKVKGGESSATKNTLRAEMSGLNFAGPRAFAKGVGSQEKTDPAEAATRSASKNSALVKSSSRRSKIEAAPPVTKWVWWVIGYNSRSSSRKKKKQLSVSGLGNNEEMDELAANKSAVTSFEAMLESGGKGRLKVVVGRRRKMGPNMEERQSIAALISLLVYKGRFEKGYEWVPTPWTLWKDGITQIFTIDIGSMAEWEMLGYQHMLFAIDCKDPPLYDQASIKDRRKKPIDKRDPLGPIVVSFKVDTMAGGVLSHIVNEQNDHMSMISMDFRYLMEKAKFTYEEGGSREKRKTRGGVLQAKLNRLNFYKPPQAEVVSPLMMLNSLEADAMEEADGETTEVPEEEDITIEMVEDVEEKED